MRRATKWSVFLWFSVWLCACLCAFCTRANAADPEHPPTQIAPPNLPPLANQPVPSADLPPNLPPPTSGPDLTLSQPPKDAVSPQLPTSETGTTKLSIERKRRINLIIAGVSTLVATYTADRMLARDLSQSYASWVPLVGPWWMLHEEGARPNPNQGLQTLFAIDGLVQLSGLTVAIVGTFLRYDRVVLRLTK